MKAVFINVSVYIKYGLQKRYKRESGCNVQQELKVSDALLIIGWSDGVKRLDDSTRVCPEGTPGQSERENTGNREKSSIKNHTSVCVCTMMSSQFDRSQQFKQPIKVSLAHSHGKHCLIF